MELLSCIKDTLIEQLDGAAEYNNISFAEIYHISETTIEGMMFWEVLFISYSIYGIYDYITLIKIYHRFGKRGMKIATPINHIYASHFDCNTLRLSDKGVEILFEKMTNYLQRYGKD